MGKRINKRAFKKIRKSVCYWKGAKKILKNHWILYEQPSEIGQKQVVETGIVSEMLGWYWHFILYSSVLRVKAFSTDAFLKHLKVNGLSPAPLVKMGMSKFLLWVKRPVLMRDQGAKTPLHTGPWHL